MIGRIGEDEEYLGGKIDGRGKRKIGKIDQKSIV